MAISVPMPAATVEVAGDEPDPWARWLLHRRHGDDPECRADMEPTLLRFADQVLEGARLTPGSHLLDIGCGDGLVGFRALGRAGYEALRVTFADHSARLLAVVRQRAERQGLTDRCRYVACDAQDLASIADRAADAVTSRAVIVYLPDKARAFRSLFRVLKPGGRLSIAEPIMRPAALPVVALRQLLERGEAGSREPLLPLLHRWKAAQFPDTEAALEASPLTNFTEQTLAQLAEEAGFTRVTLDFPPRQGEAPPLGWAAFLRLSPHPLAPSLGDILEERFSPREREALESHLRPRIEAGGYDTAERVAYLTAIRPADG